MKLVKEILYEKKNYMEYINFTEDNTDPVKDMGIGTKISIEEWLKSMEITDYKLTKKNAINVYNSIMLGDKNLTEFPEYIKFNHIMGGFHVKKNYFSSLRGFPYSITGSFIASRNKLTSLTSGPFIVKDTYGVSHNLLESLEGIAESIGNDVYLNDNKLKTLQHIPSIIKGTLNIQDNPIETLNGFPLEIEGDLYYTPSEIMTKENISKKCKVWGHLIDYTYIK